MIVENRFGKFLAFLGHEKSGGRMEYRLISEFFEADHDRLDELFKNYQEAKAGDLPGAKEKFNAFQSGLRRHIVWEEEILFALFENRTGMFTSGPTAVMREEHRQIKEHLQSIDQKLSNNDVHCEPEENRLLGVLTVHNQKEEEILYPAIDRMAVEGDKKWVFEAIENLSEETKLAPSRL
jgi:regulator of cell morphogenesis and NO signaling